MTRRTLLGAGGLALTGMSALRTAKAAEPNGAATPIDIGSRRELFIDSALVGQLEGKAERRLHHPAPQDLAIVHDAPWEGTGSGYHSVFRDGGLYRMYYKAWHLDVSKGKLRTDAHPLFCCYAESDDGIHWRKPELGLVEFRGSKANNIVMASGRSGHLHLDAGHPAVFKDENPGAAPSARYKAFVRSAQPNGLIPMQSPDGLRWSPMADAPVLTDGAFDSQNLGFWDPVAGEYRAYWRYFTKGPDGRACRAIRGATSPDFLRWSQPFDLAYVDSPLEQLYTNQIKPYHRAPHILIGFPTRYVERAWSDSLRALPEREHREQRSAAGTRYGTAITEGLMMASRDGKTFERWGEAFLPPGIERPGTWNYGHQYIAWHAVETASPLEGAPNELSLYAGESYWTGSSSALRRYSTRLDGFVSVRAPMKGGALTTQPFKFQGQRLFMNFATSAAGGLKAELQDGQGQPIPGHSLADCPEIFGDAIDREITWNGGGDVGHLAGATVRLRVELRDADLFAFRFGSMEI